MRTIKFRAFQKSDSQMIEWENVRSNFWWYVDWDEECELMQFTWLKDKNWKEIYEGDIVDLQEWHDSWAVRFDWRNWTVNKTKLVIKDIFTLHQITIEWRDFHTFWFEDQDERFKLFWSGYDIETAEVIWNRYENPELLK